MEDEELKKKKEVGIAAIRHCEEAGGPLECGAAGQPASLLGALAALCSAPWAWLGRWGALLAAQK